MPRVLVLFDVDGTLTAARQLIRPEMDDLLRNQLRKVEGDNCRLVGLVSGMNFCFTIVNIGKKYSMIYSTIYRI